MQEHEKGKSFLLFVSFCSNCLFHKSLFAPVLFLSKTPNTAVTSVGLSAATAWGKDHVSGVFGC